MPRFTDYGQYFTDGLIGFIAVLPIFLFPFVGAYTIFVAQAFFADIYKEVEQKEHNTDETKPYR